MNELKIVLIAILVFVLVWGTVLYTEKEVIENLDICVNKYNVAQVMYRGNVRYYEKIDELRPFVPIK